jgi:nucleoside-diphosphate-sugar epimerase
MEAAHISLHDLLVFLSNKKHWSGDDDPRMKSVLVVGGRGSLGKVIVEHLTHRLQVPVVRTYDIAKIRSNIEEQNGQTHITHFEGDVRDRMLVQEACAGAEVVIWAVMPPLYTAPVKMFHEVNVNGLQNVLSVAERSSSTSKFVYTSSTAVTHLLRPSFNQDETFPLPHHSTL